MTEANPTPAAQPTPMTMANGGNRPVPDPTVLTTDSIRREVATMRELFEAKFNALESLTDERFDSVKDKLGLGERQRVEQKSDTEKAIQAALLAQKEQVAAQAASFAESVAKSETSTAKQLEQMSATFKTEIKNIADNQSDLKDRVGKMEYVKIGNSEQKVEQRNVSAGIYAAIGIAVTVILAVLTIIAFVRPG